MYSVKLINEGETLTIHSFKTDGAKLLTGKHNWSVLNKLDTFDFSLAPNNPAYRKVKPFKSKIEVTNELTGEVVFFGRVLPDGRSMGDDGMIEESYKAVDWGDVLHDSYQLDYTYYDTPKTIVDKILKQHNALMSDASDKQFKNYRFADVLNTKKTEVTTENATYTNVTLAIGDKATIKRDADYFNHVYHGFSLSIADFAKERINRVTAVDLTNKCYQVAYNDIIIGWINSSDIYETKTVVTIDETTEIVTEPLKITIETMHDMTTFDALMAVIEAIGGEFYTRYKDGINFFEVTDQIGKYSETPIRLAKNILSMDIQQAFDAAYSRIIPYGKITVKEA